MTDVYCIVTVTQTYKVCVSVADNSDWEDAVALAERKFYAGLAEQSSESVDTTIDSIDGSLKGY